MRRDGDNLCPFQRRFTLRLLPLLLSITTSVSHFEFWKVECSFGFSLHGFIARNRHHNRPKQPITVGAGLFSKIVPIRSVLRRSPLIAKMRAAFSQAATFNLLIKVRDTSTESRRKTYSKIQWAAVTTVISSTRVPPQYWVPARPEAIHSCLFLPI